MTPRQIAKRMAAEAKAILTSIQLACLAVVPFVIFISLLLLLQSFSTFELNNTTKQLIKLAPQLLMVLLTVTYSYQLSIRANIDKAIGVTCACTASVLSYLISNDIAKNLPPLGFITIFVAPTFSIYTLKAIAKIFKPVVTANDHVWSKLTESHQLILPFIITMVISGLFFAAVRNPASEFIFFIQNQLNGLPDVLHMFSRTLIAYVMWSFGLHGYNLFGTIFSTDILFKEFTTNLTYLKFYDLFVLYGGCGSALSLWIALLIGSKNRDSKKIALIATPFVIFNIPEIILFGLPVILNKIILKPFILVPCVNFLIGYLVIQSGIIVFYQTNIPWTTPALLNGFIATQGNPSMLFIQLGSILLGVLIYLPFVKKYTSTASMQQHMDRLKSKLNISSHIEAKNFGKYQADQAMVIKTHSEVDKIIELLERSELEVHLQPKIPILDQHIFSQQPFNHFEALLRIKSGDGTVKGPFFLNTLESAGLAGIIDLWVCHEVKKILNDWKGTSEKPRIAINLHPDSIKDSFLIDKIINALSGEMIDFEIIERGDATQKETVQNLDKLRSNGFRIALDDFGTGNATLGVLGNLPLDVVKFDKSMLDACASQKGLIIYQLAADLCKKLNLESVTEGVETPQQLDLVRHMGINYVQGYLICRPAPVSSFHAPFPIHNSIHAS